MLAHSAPPLTVGELTGVLRGDYFKETAQPA
jgi:hypothetical protein